MPITPQEQALQETERLLAQDALRPQASHSRRPITLDDLIAEQAAGAEDPVAKAKRWEASQPIVPNWHSPEHQQSEKAAGRAQERLQPMGQAAAYGKPVAEGGLAGGLFGASLLTGPVGLAAGGTQLALQMPELMSKDASTTSRVLAALSLLPMVRQAKELYQGEKAAVTIGKGFGYGAREASSPGKAYAEAVGGKTKYRTPPSEGGFTANGGGYGESKPPASGTSWAAGETPVSQPMSGFGIPKSRTVNVPPGAEYPINELFPRTLKDAYAHEGFPPPEDTILADMQQRLGVGGRGQTAAVREKLASSHNPGWQEVSLDTPPEPSPATTSGLVPADIESRTRPDYLTQDVVPNARLNPSWSHGGPGSVNPMRPEESVIGLLRELGLDSPANMRSLRAGQPIYPEGTLPAAKAVRQRMKISGPR